MTTILAAVAVVLFAILIAVCVFGFFLYQQEKWNERKDEIKSQPGQYHPIADISSLHPSSCVSETPFGYRYNSYSTLSESSFRNLKHRMELIEKETIDNENDMTLLERVKKLEEDVQKLNQFYYIPSDSDDKSLVDMYKDLEERYNKLYQMMSDRIMDINDLRFKYDVFKSSYPRQSEYKITVGDDPNWMQNGTTVSTAETIPHFTQYRRTIPYVKAPYEFCKMRFKTIEDAKKVAKEMRTAIDQNGYCSVGRYLELSGGKTIPEDFNHGWTDLNQALVQFVDDDDYPYRLVFPEPKELDEDEKYGIQE